ncbi:TIGR04104 family putative zinc finger protein [Sporosarcina sp. A2]|uniref:TIGR04104 family putative zinc finger protein n=1 Tax=Sporosarcina sp. A2 TaxID=3393449 RepID=UPI003D795172
MVFIQKCQNCNAQFSWRKIYKSCWWNYKPIKCNECGTTHKITFPGRIIFVSSTILPMIIFGNLISLFRNLPATLVIALFILFIGSLLTPFFVTYKKILVK